MIAIETRKLRDRAQLHLAPHVAAAAGMTLSELQQFVAGSFWPSDEQLQGLAAAMGLRDFHVTTA